MKTNISLARFRFFAFVFVLVSLLIPQTIFSQRTQKPILYGRHWVAVTGKPLGATAGAMIFQRGGNAVDAACAMIAATATMWGGASTHGDDYGIAW